MKYDNQLNLASRPLLGGTMSMYIFTFEKIIQGCSVVRSLEIFSEISHDEVPGDTLVPLVILQSAQLVALVLAVLLLTEHVSRGHVALLSSGGDVALRSCWSQNQGMSLASKLALSFTLLMSSFLHLLLDFQIV